MTADRVERFWAKVEKTDDCWLWLAAMDENGYGLFGTKPSRCERAHRVSWQLAHGEIGGGLCVLHSCDTPACVRPDHLFLGTRDDNMRDRNGKGRQARGERHPRARLQAAQVVEARRLRVAGARVKDLAATFGVPEPTMSAACTGRTWRHV